MKKPFNRGVRSLRGVLAAALILSLGQSACFGSFRLTTAVWKFNKNASDEKFVQELVFLALVIIPVYGLATLADALVVNTIEFWTGNNPVNAGLDEVGNERIVQLEDGSSLRMLRESEEAIRVERGDEVLRIRKVAGAMVVEDAEGKVLSTVQEAEDGAIERVDASGERSRVEAWELAEAGHTPEALATWATNRN